MTEPWQRFRDSFYFNQQLGFALDLSRMKFPPTLFIDQATRITDAFASMDSLEKGGIANPDENRMVGHYWLRDSALAPSAEVRTEIDKTLAAILRFANDVHSGNIKPQRADRFTNTLVIGIGGSALGPEFVSSALTAGPKGDKTRVFFFDNTDPDGMDRTLAQIADGLVSTLTVVISKSGGTKETRNGMLEAKHAYERAGLDFSKHVVAITGDASELDNVAKSQGWIARFPMWDWVGGRTSELSAVGLLPAALQGIDVKAMLDGAKEMDAVTRLHDVKKNPAMQLALAWWVATGGKGAKDMVILPYKDRLELFSRYLQQLVMESLGKEKDLKGNVVHQGIAVYGNKGSTDQHAYVQQLRDGVANFFVTFIRVLHDRDGETLEVDPATTSGDYLFGFLEGTRRALWESGRESITLTLDRVNARYIGMLIALYERTVGFYGSLVGINAYHQPGVEAGKKAAATVLDLQKKAIEAVKSKGPVSAEEAAKIAGTDDVETTWKILWHLASNQGRGITKIDAPNGDPLDAKFKAT